MTRDRTNDFWTICANFLNGFSVPKIFFQPLYFGTWIPDEAIKLPIYLFVYLIIHLIEVKLWIELLYRWAFVRIGSISRDSLGNFALTDGTHANQTGFSF